MILLFQINVDNILQKGKLWGPFFLLKERRHHMVRRGADDPVGFRAHVDWCRWRNVFHVCEQVIACLAWFTLAHARMHCACVLGDWPRSYSQSTASLPNCFVFHVGLKSTSQTAQRLNASKFICNLTTKLFNCYFYLAAMMLACLTKLWKDWCHRMETFSPPDELLERVERVLQWRLPSRK